MDNYEKQVFDYLKSLKTGQVLNIYGSPTYERFVEVAKRYIDKYGDLEFNFDYSKIRKL